VTITWFVRFLHVLAGATWVGGFAMLALLLVPALKRDDPRRVAVLVLPVVRFLTVAGVATLIFGLLLIDRTRGFGRVGRGEWGQIMVLSVVIWLVMMSISDNALRPRLRRIAETGEVCTVQRWALAGLALGIVMIGLMTRTIYASS
jgi:putative copper export protein